MSQGRYLPATRLYTRDGMPGLGNAEETLNTKRRKGKSAAGKRVWMTAKNLKERNEVLRGSRLELTYRFESRIGKCSGEGV